jgi:hypothetical protein
MTAYESAAQFTRVFPYCVSFPRTDDWWNGEWRDISNWCSETIGGVVTHWEYMDKCFWFKREEDKTLFLLKWK